MGLAQKHTLSRGPKTPRKVTPIKPSPTEKTVAIKVGVTKAKREAVLLQQQQQQSPRRKDRDYRYYSPLVLVVVVGMYVANPPQDQIHPWLSSPFSQTSTSPTTPPPTTTTTSTTNDPMNGRVIQLPIPRTFRKMGKMTPPSRTFASVRNNSGYSWIHQRAELIDWDTIQTSYQDIVRQIKSKTALAANQTKTVVHEVTGVVAVATIVFFRSTHIVLTGSVHRVESLVGTVASKTRQWLNALPPMILPNTMGKHSPFQFLPTSSHTTNELEITRNLLPVPTRSSHHHGRYPAVSTTTTTTPTVPQSRMREEYSFPTTPSRNSPSAREEEALVIASPQSPPSTPHAPSTPTTPSQPAVQRPILPSMIIRPSSSSPQQHFQKWVEKIQRANIATFHFEQQRTTQNRRKQEQQHQH